jgi:hypothetical protein
MSARIYEVKRTEQLDALLAEWLAERVLLRTLTPEDFTAETIARALAECRARAARMVRELWIVIERGRLPELDLDVVRAVAELRDRTRIVKGGGE